MLNVKPPCMKLAFELTTRRMVVDGRLCRVLLKGLLDHVLHVMVSGGGTTCGRLRNGAGICPNFAQALVSTPEKHDPCRRSEIQEGVIQQ